MKLRTQIPTLMVAALAAFILTDARADEPQLAPPAKDSKIVCCMETKPCACQDVKIVCCKDAKVVCKDMKVACKDMKAGECKMDCCAPKKVARKS